MVVWSLSLVAVGVPYVLLYIRDYERGSVYKGTLRCIDMISGDAGEAAEAQLLYIVAWSLLLLGSWTFLGGILDLLVEEDYSKKW